MAIVSHKRRSTAIAFAERFVQLIQGLNIISPAVIWRPQSPELTRSPNDTRRCLKFVIKICHAVLRAASYYVLLLPYLPSRIS